MPTLIERRDGFLQEARPSCCWNGHRWRIGDRSFQVVGHHVRSWQCLTPDCGSVVTDESGTAGPSSAYPAPIDFSARNLLAN